MIEAGEQRNGPLHFAVGSSEVFSMIYPDDDNGDVLRRMEARGDDLTKPRNIDFAVVFADANSAEQFAEHFRASGYEVSVEEDTEDNRDFPWDVVVVQHMAPSYEAITNFEDLLQSVADRWGGHNDGWGCFSQPRKQ
jgi:regulator of RNase E activity RraB